MIAERIPLRETRRAQELLGRGSVQACACLQLIMTAGIRRRKLGGPAVTDNRGLTGSRFRQALCPIADANTSVVPTKPFSTTVEVALKQSRDMMTHGQTMRFGHVDTHQFPLPQLYPGAPG